MDRIEEDLADEIRDLMEQGFKAGWMREVKVGDIFKVARSFSFDKIQPLLVCERILHVDATFAENTGEIVPHVVVSMIVTDEDGLERHISYSHSYDVYIFKP
jgi:hypothetical protein